MEQHNPQQRPERRQQTGADYKGDDRRKPDPMKQMPGGNPQGGNPPTTAADRMKEQKREQQED